jgi:hypothetical protein
MFLERLFNNNESEYFFLRAEPTLDFPEDCCAFLRLSIALQAEHYEDCIASRVLSLSDEFSTKLGWLVGNIYSRVGTRDWKPEELRTYASEKLKGVAIWLEARAIAHLSRELEKWRKVHPGEVVQERTVKELAARFPKRKDQVIARFEALLEEAGSIQDPGELKKALNLLRNDPQLTSLLRG